MTKKKDPLQKIAARVLSKKNIARAVKSAEPQLPVFETGQTVNWKGKAAKVNQVFGNGTVEIAVTEYVTVSVKDIR